MLLWPPAVFPPMHAGTDLSKEKPIAEQIMKSDTEPAPLVKRTDIKKLLENGVATTVVINGKTMICDEPGCTETPTNFWVDSESGCRACRCDKHK